MFIGEAERSSVGSAAIYAGVTNTFLRLTKAWDRIRHAVNAVLSVDRNQSRVVGYAA